METRTTVWEGIPAIELMTNIYRAVILPGFGANCIRLTYLPRNIDILRFPDTHAELRSKPVVFGLPILFPPNRVCDGSFPFNGIIYKLPINEPARNHHIHGVLNSSAFEHERAGEFVFHAGADRPYMSFPHHFTVRRSYRLTDEGLKHDITVTNDGQTPMPLGIGVHTSINIPRADTRLFIPVRREWPLNDRYVPTGKYICSSPLIDALRNGTQLTREGEICSLLEVSEGTGRLVNSEYTIRYKTSDSLPFITLWNDHGGKEYVCPEPQSCLTNAPNLALSRKESGFDALEPGETRAYSMEYSLIEAERSHSKGFIRAR